MEPALILIGILVVVGGVLYVHDRFTRPTDNEHDTPHEPEQHCSDATCVLHDNCPSEQLLAGVCAETPVYYDDEELDAFAGRHPDEYTAEEVEQFRDVLYTLRHNEIIAWYQSLGRRGVTLPETLHDELMMLANEQPHEHGTQ